MRDDAARRIELDEELVTAFWRNYALIDATDAEGQTERESTFWAWERIDEAALAGADGIVEALGTLADAAPDDEACYYLGASPLEDLIRSHAEIFAESIVERARISHNFQTALRCVWFGDQLDLR